MPLPFEQRMEAARFLHESYSAERNVHLGLCLVSSLGLLWFGYQLLDNDTSLNAMVSMFGPAGLIAVSQGRVLFLWTETAKLLREG
ncbi:hypothetical protein [Phenylobacterium sp.]|uniref:hypothetical protein n=1 Tax=Phenylobacterium sp. TaxID=1871053 RepID=UPI003D2A14B0